MPKPVQCVTCTSPVAAERVEFGYRHCPAPACVAVWRKAKLEREYRLDLVPKQGFALSFRNDPTAVTMGRSSGRSV